MHLRIQTLARLAFVTAAAIASSCSAGQAPIQGSGPRSPVLGQQSLSIAQPFSAAHGIGLAITRPALIAVDGDTGALEFWPIKNGGGHSPQTISPPLGIGYADLGAHGNVVAIASSTQGVVLYNVATGAQSSFPDPFGTALTIAIDKSENIYVANSTQPTDSVVVYPAHNRRHPRDLSGCGFIKLAGGVAADNEGDVFVAVLTPKFAARIIELPNGPNGPDPSRCMPLALKSSGGYSGVVIDPKTDDLVTLDNPDECAGGIEGRMTVYPKPYQKATGRSHDLNANCSGGIKLSADSSTVFVGDQDVSGSFTFILQRSFPDGRDEGSYMEGQPSGFTTIPNTLPN